MEHGRSGARKLRAGRPTGGHGRIITLTKSITELTVAVKSLQTDVREHKNQSHESHRRLWEHNEKQDAQIEKNRDKIAEREKEINAIKGRNQK